MPKPPEQASPRALSTLEQFCVDHSISRSFYYKLRTQGRGPAETKLGKLTMVSAESAAAWRHRMEAETAAA